jgi:tRNA 2-selenouridine synthase
MEAMRASPCIALHLPQAARVELLMEDYVHFVNDPAILNKQLDCLTVLYGKEKIGRWQEMADGGMMRPLVDELLVQHYDPAYIKSIDRNFALYDTAQPLVMTEISPEAFATAARALLASQSAILTD